MLQDIIGQPYAVTVLQNALSSDRLAGSYLFVGPEGVGKATTARAFAKHLCGAQTDTDLISRAIDAGTFPDVRAIDPQGPSRIIVIPQIWPRDGDGGNAMLRDLHFEPVSSPKRVFIIHEAEGLNRFSGNSLLKTLEEPPAYAHFILTATSPGAVLPTIVSRCQVVRFGLLPMPLIEDALTQRFEIAPAQARSLTALSEGRLGYALSLARTPAALAARSDLLDLAGDLVSSLPIKAFKVSEEFRKRAAALKAVTETTAEGGDKEKTAREPLLRSLDLLATYVRDLLAITVQGPGKALLINADRQSILADGAARYQPAQLTHGLRLVLAIRRAVERNANAQLAFEVLFSRLAALAD